MSTRPLAQVEWQLIMRMCDLSSLLALARCSKETLRASMHDFAWSALSPVIFRSTRPQIGVRVSTSLLRHAEIGVRWCDSPLCWNLARELSSLASIPRLRLLDARSSALCDTDVGALLRSPTFDGSHLTSMMLGPTTSSLAIIRALAAPRCPLLCSLRIVFPCGQAEAYAEKIVKHLPCLTDLDLESLEPEPHALRPLLTAGGLALRKIALRGFNIEVWLPLLTSPKLRLLQEVTLDRLDLARVKSVDHTAEWTACFSNLTSLRSLTLEHCSPMICILTALIDHASATLRSLHVSLSTHSLVSIAATGTANDLASSIALWQRLLQQRSVCDLTLQIPSKDQFVTEHRDLITLSLTQNGDEEETEEQWSSDVDMSYVQAAAAAALEWMLIQAAYATLQSAHPLRVSLSCSGPPSLADAPPVLEAAASSHSLSR